MIGYSGTNVMRKIALACMALLITTAAESREMPAMSVAPNSDVLLAQSQNMDFNSSQSRPDRQKNNRARFACVITPPESARRSQPYVCRVETGRAGGRCRCPGIVGSGNLQPVW
jgi:hypothetical protein